jgi:hypothetical protein
VSKGREKRKEKGKGREREGREGGRTPYLRELGDI